MRGKRIDAAPPNPSGYCMCGCGEKTPLAKTGSLRDGTVRGEHVRFIKGHWSRDTAIRYVQGVDHAAEPVGPVSVRLRSARTYREVEQ